MKGQQGRRKVRVFLSVKETFNQQHVKEKVMGLSELTSIKGGKDRENAGYKEGRYASSCIEEGCHPSDTTSQKVNADC